MAGNRDTQTDFSQSSGWYAAVPAPGSAKRLSGPQKADWVVVGAGLTGLAAAMPVAAVTDAQFNALDSRVGTLEGQVGGLSNRVGTLEGQVTLNNFRMDELDRALSGGIAAAMALGQARIVPDSNLSVTVAGATYNGQQGFAGSLTGRVSEKVYISAGVSGNTGDDSFGGTVSASFGF